MEEELPLKRPRKRELSNPKSTPAQLKKSRAETAKRESAKKAAAKAKKQKKLAERVYATEAQGGGKFVRTDEHGEWREVPGGVAGVTDELPDGVIRAAEDGWVEYFNGKQKRWIATEGSAKEHNARKHVHIRGNQYFIHRLVCLAFWGKPPANKNVCCHCDNDESNNSARNLRWDDQAGNADDNDHSAYATRRNTKPVEIRHVTWDEHVPWAWFVSFSHAAEWLDCAHSSIFKALAGTRPLLGGIYQIRRWYHESQENLPATTVDLRFEHNPDSPTEYPAEEWKRVRKTAGAYWCSNRARFKYMKKGVMSDIYTPMPTKGHRSAAVGIDGTDERFHNVLWRTWFPNRPLVGNETIDHIDINNLNNNHYHKDQYYEQ